MCLEARISLRKFNLIHQNIMIYGSICGAILLITRYDISVNVAILLSRRKVGTSGR